MITGDEIHAAIERGITDATLAEKVEEYWRAVALDLISRNHDRDPEKLRASDAGSCSLELYHQLHGNLDIPDDAKAKARMMNGSLMGAWFACCLKAGLEAVRPELRVLVENVVQHEGISGHVDATILSGLLTAEATCEMKWTAWTGDWRGDCKPSHRIQSGKYALAEHAPKHFVINYYASSPDRIKVYKTNEWIDGNYLVVHPFDTLETMPDVEAEYKRLEAALGIMEPDADPPADWNCKYCKYSGCDRNKNPNRPDKTAKQLSESLTLIKGGKE